MCFFIKFKHIKIVPEYNILILGHIPVPSVGGLNYNQLCYLPKLLHTLR